MYVRRQKDRSMDVLTTQQPTFATGQRVIVTRPGLPYTGRIGVIDQVIRRPSGYYLYRVTDPYAREPLGCWADGEIAITSEGRPEFDPALIRLGADMLLAPRKARLAKAGR